MAMPTETQSKWNQNPPLPAAITPASALVGAPSVHARQLPKRMIWPALMALLGFGALSIDIFVAHYFRANEFPGALNKACQLAEVFGHGIGAAAILLTVWVLSREKRIRLPRVIAATYLGGLTTNVVKLCLARERPHAVEHLMSTSALNTFKGWFPLFSNSSDWQSFPSSHSAVAVGLALGLAWLFPRGKWLFAAFAVLAFTQRIASGNHFLSDALWGGAIGWICAAACLPGGWVSPLFDRLEAWQLARAKP